ncbi:FMN-binding protein MioC [Thorsellia anophelis]|uniref:MioC protein n=1 Tax=Thorsellia anophelis DSM 18579 TaxID=1123402 RepID=A0A1H9YSW7_9GAMM|nr:FMN-binding protein MioC [Thorsellia anophelis]SES72261.1 MioC protein [Thorsellia anophelis DSM 18579]
MSEKITLITGSSLGNAEYVAEHLEPLLGVLGLNPEIKHGPKLDETPLFGLWLVICSTHGAGDLPDNLQPWLNELEAREPDLSQVKFGAIGLGSSEYDLFCGAIKTIETVLTQLGATKVGSRLEIDATTDSLPEEVAEAWLDTWVSNLQNEN